MQNFTIAGGVFFLFTALAVPPASAFDALTLVNGLNLSYDNAESTTIGGQDRVIGGLFVECPLYATTRLTITPAVRFDANTDYPSDLNFKLGAVYALGSRTSLNASVAKSDGAPTFNDLYWPYTPPFMEFPGEGGNPGLIPETGNSADAGVSSVRETLSLDYAQ